LDEKEKIIENLEKKIDFYENNNEKWFFLIWF
jgi:hypothetical protein